MTPRALAWMTCAALAGAAAPASAEAQQIIAIDPQPHPLPVPPPPRESPRESFVVLASGLQAWMSDDGGMTDLGQGGVLSFTWLQRRGDFPTGVDVSGVFLATDDASVYDLSFRILGSPKIGRRSVVPFAAFGLAAGASRLASKQPDAMASYGWSIGPSAAVGLHGFLGDRVYWRGGAGFLGTGFGAVTAELGLGMVIE